MTKVVFAVLVSMILTGSVLAGSVPATGSERKSTSRFERDDWNKPASHRGVRVSIGSLRGPMDKVLHAQLGAKLREAGYIVVKEDLVEEDSHSYRQTTSRRRRGLPTIPELIAQANGSSRSAQDDYERPRRQVDADYVISGYFDTDGVVRTTVGVERSGGARIGLEGLMAGQIEEVGTDEVFDFSIRESWNGWIGSVSVGRSSSRSRGSFPTIWSGRDRPAVTVSSGAPSYLKAYEEVYERIATKIVAELNQFALPRR